MKDKVVEKIIKEEELRQDTHVELIASENFVSNDILEAVGSVFTNKYAEGYPGKRYYGGCEIVDKIETLAIERAKEMFGANYANVQPLSGSTANFSAYNALLEPGDTILGMELQAGGHLTHGFKVSVTGRYWKPYSYAVNKETLRLDYEEIREIALKVKPKLIICGASAYPRIIDWKEFVKIGKEVGAYVLADIAHIAGLIAAGLHPNPLKDGVDVVTSTTHKTIRGARGGIILTNNKELAKKIDSSVFPGTQGGPLVHVIAGKAIAFGEALQPEFKEYQKQVIKNAQACANHLIKKGAKITTGGTDNHLFLINVKETFGLTGDKAEDKLFKIGIVVNKNTIPFDSESPNVTSGIRIGTPAMTTKNWKENDFVELADIIWEALSNYELDNHNELHKKTMNLLERNK